MNVAQLKHQIVLGDASAVELFPRLNERGSIEARGGPPARRGGGAAFPRLNERGSIEAPLQAIEKDFAVDSFHV